MMKQLLFLSTCLFICISCSLEELPLNKTLVQCSAPADKLTASINRDTPSKSMFMIGGATKDITKVTWRNGSAVLQDNNLQTQFILEFDFQPGTSYTIAADYTDKCGRNGTATADVYLPPAETGITAAGNFTAWGQGSTGDDRGNSVATDKFGNVYVIGNYGGTIDFGNGSLSLRGANDIFVVKYGSSGVFSWVQRISGSSGDEGKSITVDPSTGDIYVTGQVSSGAQFFDTPSNARNNTVAAGENNISIDAFVAKFDPNGNKLWHKLYGGGAIDQGVSVTFHASGLYVTGIFTYPNATFGSIKLTASGEESKQDIFLAKLNNSNGTVFWAVSIGGYDNDFASSVATDTDGTAYLTGSVASPATFRSASGVAAVRNSNATPDIFIAKYSTDGNFLQSHMAESGNNSFGNGIKVQGNAVYLTGLINGTRYGNSTISNRGSTDVFIGKYAKETLAVQWVQTAGSTGVDAGNSLDTDTQGNVYVTGFVRDNASFGSLPPLRAAGESDLFVSCYDTNGNHKWAKSTGSSGVDGASSIRLNSAESVLYVTGFYAAAYPLLPRKYSGGAYDIIIGKYPD